MAFHLAHPALNTTGKVRSRRKKYASAEAAARDRELAAEWQQRQAEWAKLAPKFSSTTNLKAAARVQPAGYVPPGYPPGREPQNIPSRPDTPGAIGARAADKIYTGTAVTGIAVQHKSCLQPIFSVEEARDSASMRR